jgi:ABC-type sugar transport system permease subunit
MILIAWWSSWAARLDGGPFLHQVGAPAQGSNFVGLDQYRRLWSTPNVVRVHRNLAVFGVLSMVFTLVIGFVLAALLDRKVRGEDVFRTIFLYPFALSFIVTGLVWQWILNPQLGLQAVVRDLGWESFTFDPLYNADIVIYGILIAGLWQGTGLIMCIMLAGCAAWTRRSGRPRGWTASPPGRPTPTSSSRCCGRCSSPRWC